MIALAGALASGPRRDDAARVPVCSCSSRSDRSWSSATTSSSSAGALHSDIGFAAAWGAFPVLTAYFVQAERLDLTALGRGGRRIRPVARAAVVEYARRASCAVGRPRVEGTMTMADGTIRRFDEQRAARADRTLACGGWRWRSSPLRRRCSSPASVARGGPGSGATGELDDRQARALRDRGVRPGRDRRDPRRPRRRPGNAAAGQERRRDGAPGRRALRQGAGRDVQLRILGALPRGRAARPPAGCRGDHVAAHVLDRPRAAHPRAISCPCSSTSSPTRSTSTSTRSRR